MIWESKSIFERQQIKITFNKIKTSHLIILVTENGVAEEFN